MDFVFFRRKFVVYSGKAVVVLGGEICCLFCFYRKDLCFYFFVVGLYVFRGRWFEINLWCRRKSR